MTEREAIARVARTAGWEVLAENGSLVIERDGQTIEIEYGSGGIPRTVRRTTPDGSRQVISQNYIKMSDVLGWIG